MSFENLLDRFRSNESVDGQIHDFMTFFPHGSMENLFEVVKCNAVHISWECIKSLLNLFFYSLLTKNGRWSRQ